MTITHVGYGSGSRDRQGIPNLLRIYVGECTALHAESGMDTVTVVETNIDDMNPEIYGHLMEQLLGDGALDVCYIPITMKKNRPATKVEVLCPPEKKDTVVQRLFAETSTIGVRFQQVSRRVLTRAPATVRTRFGDLQVKCITDEKGDKRYLPEYEACRKLALETDQPLQRIYAAVAEAVLDPTNLV